MGGGPCTHPARTDPAAVAASPSDAVAMPAGKSGAGALHLPCAVPDVPTAGRLKGVIGDPAAHWGPATEWATRPSAPATALDPPGSCAAVADPASSKPPAISAALHTLANTTPEPESVTAPDGIAERVKPPPRTRAAVPSFTSAPASHRRGRESMLSAEPGITRDRFCPSGVLGAHHCIGDGRDRATGQCHGVLRRTAIGVGSQHRPLTREIGASLLRR